MEFDEKMVVEFDILASPCEWLALQALCKVEYLVSSEVEQSPGKREVVGSVPTPGNFTLHRDCISLQCRSR